MKASARTAAKTPSIVTSVVDARDSATKAIRDHQPLRMERVRRQELAIDHTKSRLEQTQARAREVMGEIERLQGLIDQQNLDSGDARADMRARTTRKALQTLLRARETTLIAYQQIIRDEDRRLHLALVRAGRRPSVSAGAANPTAPRVERTADAPLASPNDGAQPARDTSASAGPVTKEAQDTMQQFHALELAIQSYQDALEQPADHAPAAAAAIPPSAALQDAPRRAS